MISSRFFGSTWIKRLLGGESLEWVTEFPRS